MVADEALREGQFVAGANRTGWHLRGVEAGRDFRPRFADIRQPKEGDACPDCGGALGFQTAIEVGHIFKLGTRYSEPLGATYLDEDGVEKPIVMGTYGIGPGPGPGGRRRAARRRRGRMLWPAEIAPYDVARRRARAGTTPSSWQIGEQVAERSRRRAWTSCSTTASCAPARSSPTPT